MRRDKTLMITGIVMSVGGGAAAWTGALLTMLGSSSSIAFSSSYSKPTGDPSLQTAGVITMLGGLAVFGVGLPLAIYGGRRVEAPLLPANTQVFLGPRGGGIRIAF